MIAPQFNLMFSACRSSREPVFSLQLQPHIYCVIIVNFINGINRATRNAQNVFDVKSKSFRNSQMLWSQNTGPQSGSCGTISVRPFRMVLLHFSSWAKWGDTSIILLTLLQQAPSHPLLDSRDMGLVDGTQALKSPSPPYTTQTPKNACADTHTHTLTHVYTKTESGDTVIVKQHCCVQLWLNWQVCYR